jgi:hypothetical protein
MSGVPSAFDAARMLKVVKHLRTLLDVGSTADDPPSTFAALRPALVAHFDDLLNAIGCATDVSAPRPRRASRTSAPSRGDTASVSAYSPALVVDAAARASRSARSASPSVPRARAERAADERAAAPPLKQHDSRGGPNVYGVWRAARAAADDRPMNPAEARAAWARIKASPMGKTMAALQKRANSIRRRRDIAARALDSRSPLVQSAPRVTRALVATFASGSGAGAAGSSSTGDGAAGGGATAVRGRAVTRTAALAAGTPAARSATGVFAAGAPTPSVALALLGFSRTQSRRAQ